MRVAHIGYGLILGCILAAAAVSLPLIYQYQSLEDLQRQQEKTQIGLSEVKLLRISLGQWFTTLDLFFSDEETYLLSGITRQGEQIQQKVAQIQFLLGPFVSRASEMRQYMDEITKAAQALASLPPGRSEWLKGIEMSDAIAVEVISWVEQLEAGLLEEVAIGRKQIQQDKQWLEFMLVLLGCGFLVLMALLALVSGRYLVRPIEVLIQQVNNERENKVFAIEHGPRELRQLSQQFALYNEQLAFRQAQTEQARENAESLKMRLRAVMDTAPVGIMWIDKEARIKVANQWAASLLSQSQLSEHSLSEVLGDSASRRVMAHIQKIHESEHMEVDVPRGNKAPMLLELAMQSLEAGESWVLVFRDISERRRQEEEARKLNQRLIETSRQAGIAEVATAMLHNIGNALNSLMTSIQVSAEQIRRSRAKGVTQLAELFASRETSEPIDEQKLEQIAHYLCVLDQELTKEHQLYLDENRRQKQVAEHIRDIVNAQQEYAVKLNIEEKFALDALIQTCVELHKTAHGEQGPEVKCSWRCLPIVNAEKHKLQQVITNLLKNAAEAIQQGGNPNQGEIHLVLQLTDSFIELKVKDTGVGLSDAQREKLFQFGYTTKERGHGFGLHGCALIAREMGGRIDVHSEGEGRGAEFIFKLPKELACEFVDVA